MHVFFALDAPQSPTGHGSLNCSDGIAKELEDPPTASIVLLTHQIRASQPTNAEGTPSRTVHIKAKLVNLAEQKGFSVEELFGKSRRTTRATVRFRNPKNATETWAGRGRRPLWLTAALKKGAKLDSFAV